MRYLILSDIHANAIALEAVLEDAKSRSWQSVMFLGDAVGYYTDPEAVVACLIGLKPEIAIMGNHDQILLDIHQGNEEALKRSKSIVTKLLSHHHQQLSQPSLDFLASLKMRDNGIYWQAIHGGLKEPWEYLD
ncbi:MAG: metallophosphoesterase family protein, partial [Deinococcales bacterium]